MLSTQDVELNLQALDIQYRAATTTPREAELCSKLAVLELGGWTEQAMDQIVSDCSSRRLINASNRKFCTEKIIGKTYGFEYQKHFRSMLLHLVGLINVEKIESQLNGAKFAQLKAALGSLKIIRDPAAHTHVQAATLTLNAPSVTLSQLKFIRDGLDDIDRVMRKKRL